MNEVEIKKLIVDNPRSPIIYGAPKLHKDGIPLRPVVDFRNSPAYKVSKYLSQILNHLSTDHPHTIKNSTQFVNNIKNIKLRPGDTKVSFDIVSLYTNVPISDSITYIQHKLEQYDDLDSITKLDIAELLKLIKICLDNSYFRYQDTFYSQLEGASMGSPLSPIVAELYLQNLENTIITKNPFILFWKRYVDDVFAVIRKRKQQQILNCINHFHPSITFTCENEIDGKLPYTDVMTYTKKDNTIGHYVYRKPTHNNKYLNFKSFHPRAHKLGVIDTLITRAYHISDNDHLEEELKFVENVLIQNGYPVKLIQERRIKVKQKLDHPQRKQHDLEKRIIIPWAGNISSKIAGYLRRNLNVEIGYFPGPKLNSILCNTKDKPPIIRAGVYSIGCECGLEYIGESYRDFMVRIAEHEGDIRRANIRSPVALHVLENEHALDPTTYKLIIPEKRKHVRQFEETIIIRSKTDKMNISRGLNISPIWSSTLVPFFKF
jgi:hypothetical protein